MKSIFTIFFALMPFTAWAYSEAYELLGEHDSFQSVSVERLEAITANSLWNSSKTAFAFCHENSCYIVDKQNLVDVSGMENANLGKLGMYPRSSYEKVESYPVNWLKSQKDVHKVIFKTHAWREGQRYTVSEPVLVKRGTYYGR